MNIGPYKIYPIDTGTFWLDGGAMFGVIPKVLWEKTNKADERNRVQLAARCLLIIGNGKTILMDNGNGEKNTDKFRDLYTLEMESGELQKSLAKYNIKPDQITDVILSHLHFDHAGGSTVKENGKFIPAFPNAKYYVQKTQWDNSLKPTERDRASYSQNDYLPLQEHGVLNLVDGETELFDGISVLVSSGHTPALQMLKITDGSSTLFYPADLAPFTSHIPLPYIMGFDLQPLNTLADKKKIFKQAVDEDWTIFFEHDPHVVAGKIKLTEKGFAFDRAINI
jgi:glyoxylase-like metal-dependent hydrolase (beta-lactamase superfamily II)